MWEVTRPRDLDTKIWYNGPLISKDDKELIKSRGAQLVRNCDLRNTYKCILKGGGKFGTMEEYLNWCDCYAPLIMRGIIIGGSQ